MAASAAPELGPGQVRLVSSDHKKFVTNREVFSQFSNVFGEMMNACPHETEFAIKNVTAMVLDKVLEYVRLHADDPIEEGYEKPKISELDAKFLGQLNQSMVFELIMAANFLHAQALLDLTCMHVANMIKGLTPDEIRVNFNIVNDFTPEQEEEVRRDNSWAFD